MFWLLCPVLLDGAMEIKRKRLNWRCEYTFMIALFLFTTPLGHCVSCMDVLSFVFQTFEDTEYKSQNTKLASQKFETQNSKHPYTKHNVPMETT